MNPYKYSFLLTAALAASSALAAPPAAQVLAEVHAASRLAVGRLDRLPAEGDVAHETVYVTGVTAQGLGEIMGWGQDRFDNVDPETVMAIQAGFAQALRAAEDLPEGDPGSTFGYPDLQDAAGAIRGYLDSIRQAVDQASVGGGRTRQETRQAAALLTHHAGEIVGSPITPGGAAARDLLLRSLDTGFSALKTDLESFPDLREPTNSAMSTLAVLRDLPPSCSTDPNPTDACLGDVAETMKSAFATFEAAVAATRRID